MKMEIPDQQAPSEDYLPVGSVVLVNDGTEKLVILARMMKTDVGGTLYDYGAGRYPIGLPNDSRFFLFNHDEIRKVVHTGYQDELEKACNVMLKDERRKYLDEENHA